MTATTDDGVDDRRSSAVERTRRDGEVLGDASTLDPRSSASSSTSPLLHQVVTAQLAARAPGTQSTKTRAEVRGGGAKPYRQKGTGNARQGSIRAPHYAGGGVALGPKPRSYAQQTPKKMIQPALRCALSDRAAEGGVAPRRRLGLRRAEDQGRASPLSTRSACDGKVARRARPRRRASPTRRSRTCPHVATLPADQLNAYDVLAARLGRLHRRDAAGRRPPTPAASRDDRACRRPERPPRPPRPTAVTEEPAATATPTPATVRDGRSRDADGRVEPETSGSES